MIQPDFDLVAIRIAFGTCVEMHGDFELDDRALQHGKMASAAAEGVHDLLRSTIDVERARPSIVGALQLALEHAMAACRIEGGGDPAKAKAWRLLRRLLHLELQIWQGGRP
jgi:hypothetical protein